ncbi:hypothetical protein [Azospirillum picis]|uniref:Uncharacterized protein n=1 Tax=Azospirillum picis TaxID=488438 RepID=A0ABU0MU34_9PROT|nr:hypothetical protein [Azospirillum picis]MBP2300907.1 hypothetical protein [Azospirillum picis]MDQ0537011.1 hypothetical protein [Azospirillum picis]
MTRPTENFAHSSQDPLDGVIGSAQLVEHYLRMSVVVGRVFARLSLDEVVFLFKVHRAWHGGQALGYKSIRAIEKISYQTLKARVQKLAGEGWITLLAGMDKRTTQFQPSEQLEWAVKQFAAEMGSAERKEKGTSADDRFQW